MKLAIEYLEAWLSSAKTSLQRYINDLSDLHKTEKRFLKGIKREEETIRSMEKAIKKLGERIR